MADTQPITDIFSGSLVKVAISSDTKSETSFSDPSFIDCYNVAEVPMLSSSTEVAKIETYDSDTESAMSGNTTLNDATLSLYTVAGDPIQQTLSDALKNKKLMRFRNFFVADEQTESGAETGYFQIFDAYVKAENTSGGGDSAVTTTYTLAVDKVQRTGVASAGVALFTGDWGIGAGTELFPGIFDDLSLTGNRFVQLAATSTSNPFSADTAALALQGSETQGWQLTCSPTGTPLLRVRTVAADGTSDWVTVYTSAEMPTAEDLSVVHVDGSIPMTGTLKTPQIVTDNIVFGESSGTGNDAATVRKLQVLDSDNVAVDVLTITAPQDDVSVTVNGDLDTTGTITENGQRVFSPNNLPTPAQAGAVNKKGDIMSGTLAVNIGNVGTQCYGDVSSGYGIIAAGNFSTNVEKMKLTGINDVPLVAFNLNMNPANYGQCTINGNVIYHAGNKPTASDVGGIGLSDVIDLGTF